MNSINLIPIRFAPAPVGVLLQRVRSLPVPFLPLAFQADPVPVCRVLTDGSHVLDGGATLPYNPVDDDERIDLNDLADLADIQDNDVFFDLSGRPNLRGPAADLPAPFGR